MKKTTIIIICVVYLLSILAVQFFGIPVSVPEAGEYITSIEIVDVSLNNRSVGQDTSIEYSVNNSGMSVYKFHFIENENGEYTDDATSLANNPNRIKVTYKIEPADVSQGALKIIVSNLNVVVLPKTEEFAYELVFLKKNSAPVVIIKEDKGSIGVETQVKIWGR